MSTLTLFRDPFFNTARRGAFFDSLLDLYEGRGEHTRSDPALRNIIDAINDHTFPDVRAYDRDDHFEISLVAPGLIKEDFNISLEGRNLNVSFEAGNEEDGRTIDYSSFTKSWTLPEGTSDKDVEAEYVSGILTLNINKPKSKKASAKTISIK